MGLRLFRQCQQTCPRFEASTSKVSICVDYAVRNGRLASWQLWVAEEPVAHARATWGAIKAESRLSTPVHKSAREEEIDAFTAAVIRKTRTSRLALILLMKSAAGADPQVGQCGKTVAST